MPASAWYRIESVPGCGVTKTHKILHHAWPHLFPLVDRQTMAKLGENLWLTIYDDLTKPEQVAAWDELEAWFATLAGARAGVPLTRLRPTTFCCGAASYPAPRRKLV